MAASKFLQLVAGKIKEIAGVQTSAGAGDGGKIVALQDDGTLSPTMFPAGIGATTVSAPTSENLTAGNFVNLYNNGGTLTVRKADATTNTKPAHGFVLANSTSPASATVYMLGQKNTALSGMTIGADQYLNTTAGGVTATPPSTAGNVVQRLGTALSATELVFDNALTVEVA